ncbi:O-antigen translocase [Tenuifilaceae bacterium CYCD]|nr:O-antigen translocase [Tenuifilaceae bacterium CYCD]
MTEQQTSYRQIMKATSIFGGVQMVKILILIIRSKVIAILLGPVGIGIMGLLTTTIGIIGSLTNSGLGTSSVKNVAEANVTDDSHRIALIITVLRRWVWVTGLLGLFTTLIFSPWLSQITFGNSNYTLAFVWISITLLFNQISTGQLVIMQGMRKHKYLAKANLFGAFLGLFVSVPIYYLWRIDGIVPAIIFTSLVSMLCSWYFAGKVEIEKVNVSYHHTWIEGKEMLRMGFMLSLSGLITLGASYLVRIYIGRTSGLADVGFYTAGFAIINTYVGLVFTAMGTDFYPRLSGVAHDNIKATFMINQQAEIAVLVLAPILAIFLIFINWVVVLLYSTQFIPVNGMIQWAALGMYFRAASWCIAFIMLAKGASKLFFWNELIANIYIFGLNILGYKLYGLNGLGISFLVAYILYLCQVFFLSKHLYRFYFNYEFVKIFGIQFILGLACFFIIRFIPAPISYIVGMLFICASAWFSFKELDKRLGIRKLFSNSNRV